MLSAIGVVALAADRLNPLNFFKNKIQKVFIRRLFEPVNQYPVWFISRTGFSNRIAAFSPDISDEIADGNHSAGASKAGNVDSKFFGSGKLGQLFIRASDAFLRKRGAGKNNRQ